MADTNLWATDNNIANVSTPGYSRQEAVQAENILLYVGMGYLGQGTNVTTVRRIYDQFSTVQVQSGQALTSVANRLNSLALGLSRHISDSNNSLTSPLASFFSTADSLASKPSDITVRQVFLNATASLQSCFNSIADQSSLPNSRVNT